MRPNNRALFQFGHTVFTEFHHDHRFLLAWNGNYVYEEDAHRWF